MEGEIIGYIENGRYHGYTEEEIRRLPRVGSNVDIKEWGNIQLCEDVGIDLLDDLREVYDQHDAEWIYTVALLRCCYPGVTDNLLIRRYQRSYASLLHPGLCMSKNCVCDRLQAIGTELTRIKCFMRKRTSNIKATDSVLIDGTLQCDESIVNPLSKASKNTHRTHHRDFSILYAFSMEMMEPVCSEIFPGNVIDSKAVSAFLTDNEIRGGVLIADRGFPPGSIKGVLAALDREQRRLIHYLLPLRDNRSIIEQYELTMFDGALAHHPGIEYKKVMAGEDLWYYSFRDPFMAANEERLFVMNHPDFTAEMLAEERTMFGVIVFESDFDAPPLLIYDMYEERWTIELLFKFYHSALEFDDTREHNQFSAYASSFVDLLATIMGVRMKKRMDAVNSFDNISYPQALDFLRGAMKHKDMSKEDSDWELMRMADKDVRAL